MITCKTCNYCVTKKLFCEDPCEPTCYVTKKPVYPEMLHDCKHYLESPKVYWERQKKEKKK